jgi:two-component system, cell cycle sensor histidine kinase and response regulator CckA
MQILDKNLFWFVIAGTMALLILVGGFITAVVLSRRRFLKAQRAQLEELQAREQKYRNLFENSLIGMVRLSLHDWTLLEVNEAFRRIAAKVPLDVGHNFLGCLPPVGQSTLKAELYEKGSVENFETHIRCSDGALLWISFSGRVYFNDGYVEGIVADNTLRVKAEEKLREQAALLEKAHDAIVVLDMNNVVQFWNPGAEKLFLWPASEALGRTITDLIYTEQEIPAFRKRRDELLVNGEWNGEVSQVRKDGGQVMATSRWTLVRGPDDRPKSILEIHTDITEKKLLEAKFLRIQRLESLGILAGGIAHDLNNILAPIILSIQSLKRKWDDVSSRNHLATLEASAHRGADLVKQVLTFARGIEGQRVAIGLEALVGEVLKSASQTFPRSIEFESAVTEDLWPAIGDAAQLSQVLMNLSMNAKDAMPHGGRLSITAENVVVDELFVKKNPEAKPGVYVVVQVTDTGKGIPPTELDKIFEPFYTTKSLGQGTGLGLSTALGIIKSHQGFILVDSNIGFGTTFKVYVPAQLYQSSEEMPGNTLGTKR